MINDLPGESFWSLAGIGEDQLKMNAVAIAMGGGVRVGLEDNIWFDANRTRLASNSDLLARVHALASVHNREVMPPSRFRTLLNLKKGNGQYGR
jgi:uncharacterized protein (DUF849 family)